jgi:hypothetical protein
MDLSVLKETKLGESRNIEFRAEFFNICRDKAEAFFTTNLSGKIVGFVARRSGSTRK